MLPEWVNGNIAQPPRENERIPLEVDSRPPFFYRASPHSWAAIRRRGPSLLRTPPTALPLDVRGVVSAKSRWSRIRRNAGFPNIITTPALICRQGGPSRAPLCTPPAGCCPEMYGFCLTRPAMSITAIMRAPIKNCPELPL